MVHKSRLVAHVLVLLGAFILSGCMMDLLRPDDLPVISVARKDARDFVMEGRLSVRQGESRHHAGISWRHSASADLDEILLTGPLGQGIGELQRNREGAHLTTAAGKRIDSADWESLTETFFGTRLPVSGLPVWLLGQVIAERTDALGRPLEARVDGWLIQYLDYSHAAPEALPQLIELRRDDIELRLKVDAWQMQ